ncbi:MAG: hypothetical protein ACK2UO_13995 [Caldilineaceae bacterium]
MGVRRLDRRRRLYVVPFQWQWVLDRAGLTISQAEQSLWTVSPHGVKRSGAAAVNRVLDVIAGWDVCERLYKAPLMASVQEGIYRTVARNRRYLPGATPAVEQPQGWRPQR